MDFMKGQAEETKRAEINTPDWLRSFPGCEHHSDEEAMEIIHSLKIYASILLENMAHKLNIENQEITEKQDKAA
jgi:hypothetical protein